MIRSATPFAALLALVLVSGCGRAAPEESDGFVHVPPAPAPPEPAVADLFAACRSVRRVGLYTEAEASTFPADAMFTIPRVEIGGTMRYIKDFNADQVAPLDARPLVAALQSGKAHDVRCLCLSDYGLMLQFLDQGKEVEAAVLVARNHNALRVAIGRLGYDREFRFQAVVDSGGDTSTFVDTLDLDALVRSLTDGAPRPPGE